MDSNTRPVERTWSDLNFQGVELADLFKQALGVLSGGRVLDVATGQGGFIGLLVKNLRSYTDIIGIDISARVLAMARRDVDIENVEFIQMDGERLAFQAGSFDTVNISASLHHLEKVAPVLAEMKRVLKPGGHFIISEMHCDGQTEPQLAVVHLHHWAAQVDTTLGVQHNRTLARQELVDYARSLDLCNLMFYDWVDVDSDPMDAGAIERIEGVIDERLQRVKRAANYETLKHQGEELRRRVHKVGITREPRLIIVGQKP